jgi:hypothetical protein
MEAMMTPTEWKDAQLEVATGVTDGPAMRAEYERGFIDGTQEQMRRSVDRAVNAMVGPSRNDVLEEVAMQFDKMKVFGDTAASFAIFVRGMKR